MTVVQPPRRVLPKKSLRVRPAGTSFVNSRRLSTGFARGGISWKSYTLLVDNLVDD